MGLPNFTNYNKDMKRKRNHTSISVKTCITLQSRKNNTLAKYSPGVSAHLKIVRRANSKFPEVSLFITYKAQNS